MKGTPKPKRKTAKTWPITNRNTPIKQHRRYAGLSGAELRDLICQNINNTLRQHWRYASLSKVESRDLIGRKINKGNSCASVSQYHGTGRVLKVRSKRKRSEVKVKSEPDSESSESQKIPKKRSKRSRISKTEESTDSDEYEEPAEDPGPVPPNESPKSRHRRRQIDIRQGGGSKETINRLNQRSNMLFDREGVNEEGRKFYRRNPEEKFKSPPRKPADGKSIKNHPKGKMLRASKICDQQTAGRAMRPYLNGVGFQLRLAEAIRKLLELALPDVEKPKRYKAKNGKPARLVVDPRLRYAQVTLRRVKRPLDTFDQWNNPEVGAHLVEEDQSGIPFICLGDSSENETENRRLHPKKWMGK